MQYLSELQEDQTLVMYSGHPLGVFPSRTEAPRMIITNGMVSSASVCQLSKPQLLFVWLHVQFKFSSQWHKFT